MPEYRTVKDVNVKGKYVILRVGLDVPLDQTKDLLDPDRVTDDTRIRDILPTLNYLIENGAKVILAAGWCGRPKGEDSDYGMAPVAKRLEKLLKGEGVLEHDVLLAPNSYVDRKPRSVYTHQDEVRDAVSGLQKGQIVVLENVRYDPEANANDKDFAEFIASLAGKTAVYVNEAEPQNHRPEATIVTVPLIVAQNSGEVVYGLKYPDVLEKIGGLAQKLEDPDRDSFVFGLCGKKIESDPGITSKITVAVDLIDKMRAGDTIITGGAVIYTFILAQHYSSRIEENLERVNQIVGSYNKKIASETQGVKDKKEAVEITERLQREKSDKLKKLLGIRDEEIRELIGDSYIRWGQEGEQIVFAYDVMAKAKAKGVEVITADDYAITDKSPDKSGILPEDAKIKIHDTPTNIPAGWLGVGGGPKTLDRIFNVIEGAGIYLQSGPYSIEDDRVEELSETDYTTFEAAKKCIENGGVTIGAGGDTVARIHTRSAEDAFSIITSAGGATLELIQSGTSKGKEAVELANKSKK